MCLAPAWIGRPGKAALEQCDIHEYKYQADALCLALPRWFGSIYIDCQEVVVITNPKTAVIQTKVRKQAQTSIQTCRRVAHTGVTSVLRAREGCRCDKWDRMMNMMECAHLESRKDDVN